MGRKRHSAEELVNKLRQVDVELSKGNTIAGVCKLVGMSEQTYHRWRREYSGLRADQARRFKELEQENARLKRLVADQAIDISILKEANDYLGNPRAPRSGGAS
jgi:transposase-like protein